jgi:hypothetical protein
VRIVACLGFIALLACGTDEGAAQSDHDIEGTVIDEFTQHGLSGATVRFVADTLEEAETVSESDGHFTLRVEVSEGVRFGTLEASRDGYADSKQLSVYFDGSALRAELALRPKN